MLMLALAIPTNTGARGLSEVFAVAHMFILINVRDNHLTRFLP